MIQACGDGARYLKPYQLVGVNFLNLLYRQKIGGGERRGTRWGAGGLGAAGAAWIQALPPVPRCLS